MRLLRRIVSSLRTFFTPLRLLLTVGVSAFFWFLILGDQGVYKLVQLLQMKEQLQKKQAKISAEIEMRTAEQALLNDPQKLEMVVRAELGVIKPGEIIFQPSVSTKSDEMRGRPE